MRRLSLTARVSPAILVAVVVCAVLGCDQLNKPLSTSSSSSSSSGGGSSSNRSADAGDAEGGLAPAPTITAQPGDLQL